MSEQYISLPSIVKNDSYLQNQFNKLINTVNFNGNYDEKARKSFVDSLFDTVIQENQFSSEESEGIYEIIQDYAKGLIAYYQEVRALEKINANITAMVKDNTPNNTDGLFIAGLVLLFFFILPGLIMLAVVEYKLLRRTNLTELNYYEGVASNFEDHYAKFLRFAKTLNEDFGFEDKYQFVRMQNYFERLNNILVGVKMPKMIVITE